MAGELTEAGASYSSLVGLVYVFNLIVGTGALTMPSAFGGAGWLVSTVVVCALCFMSFMTVTFVIETMAAANAIRKYGRREEVPPSSSGNAEAADSTSPDLYGAGADDETKPLLSGSRHVNTVDDQRVYFEITERIEMSQMAEMFFNKPGTYLFYACVIVYLYGDLAIYAAAVPKSLRDVACTWTNSTTNTSFSNETLPDDAPCWPGLPGVNREDAYRIFLAVFIVPMGTFMFFNVQKTKYLQHFTTVMRWLAFGAMIVLAAARLVRGEGAGRPLVAAPGGLPTLFGVCVYAFMCHHSLPSLTTPVRDKQHLTRALLAAYLLILSFYLLLSLTGVFAFATLEDLYTLNFLPGAAGSGQGVAAVQYFLSLFPVFTLSANFPLIGITLRNNLQAMFLTEGRQYGVFTRRLLFPGLTLLPPAAVAFFTDKVDFLVGVTGSYAGAGIQYFVPALLVLCARRHLVATLGSPTGNQHRSPFKHPAWFIFTLVWGAVCIVFVTVNHIISRQ